MTRARRGSAVATVVLIAVALTAAGLSVGNAGATSRSSVTADPSAVPALTLRPLQTSADHQIVDDTGRQVLLRGANVNALGQYWQGVPGLAPTLPVTAADWDTMAAHGFSVIRLIITWSRVEPTRGTIDQTYLDQVDASVRAAAAHGIATVLDMHQDAYTDAISTTDPAACPAGTTPAKGWDGAPAWATITDGLSTCLTAGDRNSSPAVTAAWNHFYDDTDGIRDELAAAWGAVAARFAGRPEIAGYDLLNEPEVSRPADQLSPLYDAFIGSAVRAIRDAEHAAGASFDHIIFVEPGIPAADLSRGIMIPDPARIGLGTDNIVAAPHNYAESITPGFTIESMSDVFDTIAAGLGVPTWIGEYGFWDTSPDTLAKVRRYAANEDAKVQGGAWWQWRQSCGDPHTVQWQGGTVVSPPGEATHLNRMQCPANTDLGPNDAFLDVLGRAYPRATPGRVTTLRSDPDTGVFTLEATASPDAVGGQLVVWTPTADDATHRVATRGLAAVTETPVTGGRIITARVAGAGDYALTIGTALPPTTVPATPAPTTTPGTTGPTTPPTTVGPTTTRRTGDRPTNPHAARPVVATPRYTG